MGFAARLFSVAVVFVSIAVMDAATGLDLTLRALYLLPVGAAAWLLGLRAGVVVSMLSVGLSSYYDLALGLTRTHATFVYSDTIVRLGVYLAAAAAIAQLHAAQVRLRELSQTDPLTGLYNRRGFQHIADREIERAKRNGSALTIAYLDLDGFKALNDRLGHAEGDDVLVAVGYTLKSGRAADVAARLGGDEFALLMPDTPSAAAVTAVERLVGRLNEAMAARGWAVTFSVGVATFQKPQRSLDEMLEIADALTYEVKRAGKAGVKYREV
jgi:diguanylate cyclase (GGDEF)-like protein